MDNTTLPAIVVSVVLVAAWGCYRLVARSYRSPGTHKAAGNVNVVQPIVNHTQSTDGNPRLRHHIRDTRVNSPDPVRNFDKEMGSWLGTANGPVVDDNAETSDQPTVTADHRSSITDQRQLPRIIITDQSKSNISCDEWGGQLSDDDDDTVVHDDRGSETGSDATYHQIVAVKQDGDTSKSSADFEVQRLLQELVRARKASDRSQGWSDFLEKELLAHIDARIAAEDSHKRTLRRLSNTRLANKRVKQRCERLQEELRELHIGIEQCVGENNNLEFGQKAIGIQRPHYKKSARTIEEPDIQLNEDEEVDNVIRLLDEPQPTVEEVYIEELFAKEVFSADKVVDGPAPPLFNDVDEAKDFWETQYTQATPWTAESGHDLVDSSGGGDATGHTGSPKTPENSEHGSDAGLMSNTECSVQSKTDMWEERLRMGVRNHPVDGGAAGDVAEVQLSVESSSKVYRTMSLWEEKTSARSTPNTPNASPRLPHRSTKSDVMPGTIQLAKQLWEERTSPCVSANHSPVRRLSAGEENLAGGFGNGETPVGTLTRDFLMTLERESDETSDNVLADRLASVSQTKMLFEQ